MMNHSEAARLAASVLMVGLEGQSLSTPEKTFLKACRPAGVILFSRNIDQAHQQSLRGLCQEVQIHCESKLDATPLKALIAIDQEGGRVSRLKPPFPNLGPALNLENGSSNREALENISRYGAEIGRALLTLGINVNFAPVVDIFTEPDNTAIGDRTFGTTADQVILRAGAFLEGLTKAGVLGALKHFPGQGHARRDTHLEGAVIDVDKDTLKDRELRPFEALKDKAPMIMVAHAIYPALASEEASRSEQIMTGLLRNKMAYKGAIVTDDMMMAAIPQDLPSWSEALRDSLRAGADLVLVCKGLGRAEYAWQSLTQMALEDSTFLNVLKKRAAQVNQLRQLVSR